jgi:hypothetical protein
MFHLFSGAVQFEWHDFQFLDARIISSQRADVIVVPPFFSRL